MHNIIRYGYNKIKQALGQNNKVKYQVDSQSEGIFFISKESVKPLSDAMGYQSPKHGYSAPKGGTGESK